MPPCSIVDVVLVGLWMKSPSASIDERQKASLSVGLEQRPVDLDEARDADRDLFGPRGMARATNSHNASQNDDLIIISGI